MGRRIRLNEYAPLTGIDIMMHVDHAHVYCSLQAR